MKKITIKQFGITVKLSMAFVLAGLIVAGCTDDFTSPASPTGQTITAVAQADDSLKIFVAAIAKTNEAASLNNNTSGTFTVFAPSDKAFLAFFKNRLAKPDNFTIDSAVTYINTKMSTTSTVTIAALNTLLTYHIISSSLTKAMLTGPKTFATLNGARLSISNPGPVVLNANTTGNGAEVTAFDATASNGVIHRINRVLNPPTAASVGVTIGLSVNYATVPPTVSAPTTSVGTYDLFANAVKQAEVASLILPNVNPLPEVTVFAPTDAAFISYLGVADEAAALAKIKTMTAAELAPIIKEHIITNVRYLTTDLSDGMELMTANGTKITVHVADGVYTISDTNSDSADATISAANVLTNGGVLQRLSVVLRP